MSRIQQGNPQITSIKSQYLEAQKNHDTTEMNRLKAKGMELIKEVEKKESQGEISNKDGDVLNLSNAVIKDNK